MASSEEGGTDDSIRLPAQRKPQDASCSDPVCPQLTLACLGPGRAVGTGIQGSQPSHRPDSCPGASQEQCLLQCQCRNGCGRKASPHHPPHRPPPPPAVVVPDLRGPTPMRPGLPSLSSRHNQSGPSAARVNGISAAPGDSHAGESALRELARGAEVPREGPGWPLEGGHREGLPEEWIAGGRATPRWQGWEGCAGQKEKQRARARGCGTAGPLGDPGGPQCSWGASGSEGGEDRETRDEAQSTGGGTSPGDPSQGFSSRGKRD